MNTIESTYIYNARPATTPARILCYADHHVARLLAALRRRAPRGVPVRVAVPGHRDVVPPVNRLSFAFANSFSTFLSRSHFSDPFLFGSLLVLDHPL